MGACLSIKLNVNGKEFEENQEVRFVLKNKEIVIGELWIIDKSFIIIINENEEEIKVEIEEIQDYIK